MSLSCKTDIFFQILCIVFIISHLLWLISNLCKKLLCLLSYDFTLPRGINHFLCEMIQSVGYPILEEFFRSLYSSPCNESWNPLLGGESPNVGKGPCEWACDIHLWWSCHPIWTTPHPTLVLDPHSPIPRPWRQCFQWPSTVVFLLYCACILYTETHEVWWVQSCSKCLHLRHFQEHLNYYGWNGWPTAAPKACW